MADDSRKIKFQCEHCQAAMSAPEASVGKKGKCPKCGGRIEVPPLSAVVAKPAAAKPRPVTRKTPGGSLLDEVEDLEEAAAMFERGEALERPTPREAQPASAAVAKSSSARVSPPAKSASRKAGSKLGYGLLLGVLLACVGGAIGAGIWYAIVMATDYEVGYVAWGVGALAGFGMMMGVGGHDDRAGILAGGIAGLALLAGKYFIYTNIVLVASIGLNEYVVKQMAINAYNAGMKQVAEGVCPDSAAFEDLWSNVFPDLPSSDVGQLPRILENVRGDLASLRSAQPLSDPNMVAKLATYQLANMEFDYEEHEKDAIAVEAWKSRCAEAEAKLSGLPEEEKRALAASRHQEIAEVLKLENAVDIEPVGFFESSFSLFDALWFLLALGTAFRIGAGLGT